jgi:hypothetical protein
MRLRFCAGVACGPGCDGSKPPAAQSTRRAEGQEAGQGFVMALVKDSDLRSTLQLSQPQADFQAIECVEIDVETHR